MNLQQDTIESNVFKYSDTRSIVFQHTLELPREVRRTIIHTVKRGYTVALVRRIEVATNKDNSGTTHHIRNELAADCKSFDGPNQRCSTINFGMCAFDGLFVINADDNSLRKISLNTKVGGRPPRFRTVQRLTKKRYSKMAMAHARCYAF